MRSVMPEGWAIPAIDSLNRDFFTSGKVMVQECTTCGAVQHPPEEVCHACQGTAFRSRQAAGTGTIHSYTVVHHPVHDALVNAVPYAIVVVALDDHPQVRVCGNVVNAAPGAVRIGQRVRATFDEIADPDGGAIFLPQWEVVE
jgi:uncharacterized OB-fold protein